MRLSEEAGKSQETSRDHCSGRSMSGESVLRMGASPVWASDAQPLVKHIHHNYNASVRHCLSEAVVQSCLFMPLASLCRVRGMTDAGSASSSLRCPNCQ